ncbi:hypothetical protein OG785_16645 [Streptomyces sp. NBC_00006]|uniref:hypothetical protein n=1 Tax=Streptomyces sp. NBC_00006 TaxID=2975619 RepID=UPI00225B122D|nr:hypothetical protein [Streptomyces sp. NBC_00006]MCX5532193.1 hypothetical protein [Streptomyces sp. NBC_00006]
MIRDLYNVRPVPAEGEETVREWAPTPLTPEEESRYQALLFSELGNQIADRGTTTYPAHTPEERRRLVAVGQRLSAHWGMPVRVTADDECRMRLSVGPVGAVTGG